MSQSMAAAVRRSGLSPTVVALIVCQIALHGAMAGLRTAVPLLALRSGASAWAVGLLLALYSTAALLQGLVAGRLADRHGYHRPMGIAVVLTMLSALAAFGATRVPLPWQFTLLGVAALLCGAGANMGLIAIQHKGGRCVRGGSERIRVFGWLGLAYALANFFGSVAAGVLIDLAGFGAAFAFLLSLPVLSLLTSRYVSREPPLVRSRSSSANKASLLRLPALRRLLLINWLFSACWDLHLFAVPVLGHERNFSASAIGMVLGTFMLAAGLVCFLIPMVGHRLDEVRVLRGSMVGAAVVCLLYPIAPSATLMAGCAALLGVALGPGQPMILSALHRLTPEHQHGEALAWRSITVNVASMVMPLSFGAAGAVIGAKGLFFGIAAIVAAGNRITGGIQPRER
jgi:MFS family permease